MLEFEQKRMFIFRLVANLHHFFPNLFERLLEIDDFRNRPQYNLAEIIFAAIAIHIFKAGSRNAFNNMAHGKFSMNYFRAFKLSLPHLDTVDLAMKAITNDELEQLKTHLIKGLIEKKIFYKYKIFNMYYNISVDGTGVMTINEANIQNFPNALFKIYNKGKENEKRVYFINVLEAKLVCHNGFCISLSTEWIENAEDEYDKQDCELKAFIRLSQKLKKSFPRLPICIVGDGLYPNKNIFTICDDNNWQWIFTFKDGNIPSVWKKIESLKFYKKNSRITEDEVTGKDALIDKKIIRFYSWETGIEYKGHIVHWCEMIETVDGEFKHRFVYLTNLKPISKNIVEIINNGRLRFKIENEGFNCQKNLGYGLKHKYSQTSELATKNYYTCLQIGHMINQLLEQQAFTKKLTKGKETLKSLWLFLVATLMIEDLVSNEIDQFLSTKRQIRFE